MVRLGMGRSAAVMGGAVLAHNAGPVETEHYMKPVDGHIVDDVVIGTLGKGGIDVAEGDESFLGHSCREGDGVSFGNAHIEGSVGHFSHHDVHAASRGHGRCYTYDVGVVACQFQQCFSKDILIAGWFARVLLLEAFACFGIEFPRGVPQGGILLCSGESLSFFGVDVEHLGTLHVANALECTYKRNHIMSVLRSEVADIHPLEYVFLSCEYRFQRVVEAQDLAFALLVEPSDAQQVLAGPIAQAIVPAAGVQLVEVMLHAAHAVVDAHVVVVEDNEQVVGHGTGIVQTFKSQPSAHTAIADDGYHMSFLMMAVGSYSHAQCSRDAVGGMSAGKGVVFAFLR